MTTTRFPVDQIWNNILILDIENIHLVPNDWKQIIFITHNINVYSWAFSDKKNNIKAKVVTFTKTRGELWLFK